jgi:hypothetical protein
MPFSASDSAPKSVRSTRGSRGRSRRDAVAVSVQNQIRKFRVEAEVCESRSPKWSQTSPAPFGTNLTIADNLAKMDDFQLADKQDMIFEEVVDFLR